MTYEPTVWEDGQVITAEKLNKLEQGVQNEQIGPAGKDGAAATVAIGSVTTGNAGTDAQVRNRSNWNNPRKCDGNQSGHCETNGSDCGFVSGPNSARF